jgi:hypothetical protein
MSERLLNLVNTVYESSYSSMLEGCVTRFMDFPRVQKTFKMQRTCDLVHKDSYVLKSIRFSLE